jgi:hypothetical protein
MIIMYAQVDFWWLFISLMDIIRTIAKRWVFWWAPRIKQCSWEVRTQRDLYFGSIKHSRSIVWSCNKWTWYRKSGNEWELHGHSWKLSCVFSSYKSIIINLWDINSFGRSISKKRWITSKWKLEHSWRLYNYFFQRTTRALSRKLLYWATRKWRS